MKRRGAILGFGHVAEKGHLLAWRERPDAAIVAVAEPDEERRALAASLLPEAHTYPDAETLLAQESLDFVDIAAPPVWHAPLIVAAAERGAHILCEKPLAVSLDALATSVRAVRRADIALVSVHNWKQSPQYRRLQTMLCENTIGPVHRIRFETIRQGPSVMVGADWRTRPEIAGGGILFDHGWHVLYLLLGLAREDPLRVAAHTEKRRFVEAAVEDTVELDVEMPTCRGEIFLTWAGDRRHTSWQLVGERGEIEVVEDVLHLRRHDKPEETVPFAHSLSAGSHHPDWFSAIIEQLFAEMDHRTPRRAHLREAELCMRMIDRAYASAALGGRPEEILLPR